MFNGNRFSAKLYSVLSDYRIIPLIHEYFKYEAALGEEDPTRVAMERIFSDAEIEQLRTVKNWIAYTIMDLGHYMYASRNDGKVPKWVTETRMVHYHRAMAEQVSILDWKKKPFIVPKKCNMVLDIGCGLSPFRPLFEKYNKHDVQCIGVDKCSVSNQIITEVRTDNIEDLLTTAYPNVVFFGNALHCFDEPLTLLRRILAFSSVKMIIVIDYEPTSSQGITLGYHLSRHTNVSKEITKSNYLSLLSPYINISVKIGKASQQHYYVKVTKPRS